MADALTVFQHAYYIGNYMSGILYGVELVLYFLTLQGLFRRGSHNSAKSRRFFTIYSTILLLLLTIDISVNAVWGEQMWITNQANVPGFIVAETSVWYQTLGSTSVVALIFMGDALLLYRLFIIYGSSYFVIALPALAYLAAFCQTLFVSPTQVANSRVAAALAIIELILAGKPGGNFFHGKTINFGTPYYTITIAFNIFVTLAIVIRLMRLGKAVSRALGRESALMYTSVASMLIESAAPYSMVGIMFLIPYALGNGTAISFGQVWAKLAVRYPSICILELNSSFLQCLSPQLIVLRVITGKAWGREIITQAQSNVEFMVKPHVHASGIELQSHAYSQGGTTLGETATEKWNGSTKSISS
ncbi:LOW QUALITY PROTEIN: hypothetical protein CVT26_009453 [Gymnopilus dilepis]|uniref:Uncharacterized protein n=1 Tax=Gymnopilus dilepis TaxID=231916 RepID=A0A409YIC2_9AGAR|nr:LOW QUALITY PROTEIN: hypothetical protein CVT26_009453 [Gymnopilus dilepis]